MLLLELWRSVQKHKPSGKMRRPRIAFEQLHEVVRTLSEYPPAGELACRVV